MSYEDVKSNISNLLDEYAIQFMQEWIKDGSFTVNSCLTDTGEIESELYCDPDNPLFLDNPYSPIVRRVESFQSMLEDFILLSNAKNKQEILGRMKLEIDDAIKKLNQ